MVKSTVLQRIRVLFQHLHGSSTLNSSSREFNTPFSFLQASGTQLMHKNAGKTHTQKFLKLKKCEGTGL